jgi:hypothetical protein
MPKIEKLKKLKPKKKTTNLPAKSKNNTALTSAKQKEIKKLVQAYQQVGISLTKLLKPTK